MSPPFQKAPTRDRNSSASQFVVFRDFLLPEELNGLLGHVLSRKRDFRRTKIIAHGNRGKVDSRYRRSRELPDLGEFRDVFTHRIRSYLPWVVQRLGVPPFPVRKTIARVTASNDGDFFNKHTDLCKGRVITFVYYFHREPKRFAGGELRLYPTTFKNGRLDAAESFDTVMPQQNHIVFFPSFSVHQVRPVRCRSGAIEDSRFTVTGWICK
jgi:SM-20-related protein